MSLVDHSHLRKNDFNPLLSCKLLTDQGSIAGMDLELQE